MATISPNSFDPLRRYVGVRLQQGVPIVDADWNELDDVRKFEVRAFLKWFVGDGVPDGNDGFRIDGTGLANDFVVNAGISGTPNGLGNVGRCLVDGLDVIISANIKFSDQPLHANRPGSAALAAALHVPPIAPLAAPAASGTVVAYLDVWERLVMPAEDPTLVLPGLGTESCARLKREWAVRVRNGTSAPAPGDADYLAGHSYYALAAIARRAQAVDPTGTINAGDVADLREQRLLMPPATLIADLFGTDPEEYRRGRGRPAISLREAINALIRGETPSTPETTIAASPTSDDDIGRGTFFDAANGLITIWNSNRAGNVMQVFAARLSLANAAAGFADPPQQVTSGVAHVRPHAILLNTGEVLVAYESATAPNNEDVHLKRGTFANLKTGLAEIAVAADPATRERAPFAVAVDGQVLIMWHETPSNTWQFNRFDLATNTFPGPKQALSAVTANAPATPFELHAARDSAGNVWAAFRTATNNIRTMQVPPGAAPTVGDEHDTGAPDVFPFVLVDHDDNVWVFWSSIVAGPPAFISIRYREFVRATGAWDPPIGNPPALVPGTDTAQNLAPAAVTDADGGIWLFWHSNRSGSTNQDIWYVRRNPVTRIWGDPRQITGTLEADTNALALRSADGAIWLFWNRQFGANGELLFRRIITSI